MQLVAALIAMLALAFALPTTAAATDDVDRAMATAQQFWNGIPCGGQVDVRFLDMDPSTNGSATWSAPPGGGPETYSACAIDLNRRIPYSWGRLCSAMLHEVGHLLGHAHSEEPGGPMSETYVGPVGPCSLGGLPEQDGAGGDPEPAAVGRRSPRRCRTALANRRDGGRARRRTCARRRTARH